MNRTGIGSSRTPTTPPWSQQKPVYTHNYESPPSFSSGNVSGGSGGGSGIVAIIESNSSDNSLNVHSFRQNEKIMHTTSSSSSSISTNDNSSISNVSSNGGSNGSSNNTSNSRLFIYKSISLVYIPTRVILVCHAFHGVMGKNMTDEIPMIGATPECLKIPHELLSIAAKNVIWKGLKERCANTVKGVQVGSIITDFHNESCFQTAKQLAIQSNFNQVSVLMGGDIDPVVQFCSQNYGKVLNVTNALKDNRIEEKLYLEDEIQNSVAKFLKSLNICYPCSSFLTNDKEVPVWINYLANIVLQCSGFMKETITVVNEEGVEEQKTKKLRDILTSNGWPDPLDMENAVRQAARIQTFEKQHKFPCPVWTRVSTAHTLEYVDQQLFVKKDKKTHYVVTHESMINNVAKELFEGSNGAICCQQVVPLSNSANSGNSNGSSNGGSNGDGNGDDDGDDSQEERGPSPLKKVYVVRPLDELVFETTPNGLVEVIRKRRKIEEFSGMITENIKSKRLGTLKRKQFKRMLLVSGNNMDRKNIVVKN